MRRALVLACLTLLPLGTIFLAATPAAAQDQAQRKPPPAEIKDDWGRQKLLIPDATERGNWAGTWFYVSRDFQVGLWLRESDAGLPEVRVRLFRLGGGEQFDTDWMGHADYNVRGAPASFDLKLTGGDALALDGDWNWLLDFADSSRVEQAKVKLYRTGDGRRLVLRFDDFVRTIRRGAIVNELPLQQVWVFRKASKRLVDWTELPF